MWSMLLLLLLLLACCIIHPPTPPKDGQSWALQVFFNFFKNKKWIFFHFFKKLICLGAGFLNKTGAEIGYQLCSQKNAKKSIFIIEKIDKIPKLHCSEDGKAAAAVVKAAAAAVTAMSATMSTRRRQRSLSLCLTTHPAAAGGGVPWSWRKGEIFSMMSLNLETALKRHL